MPYAWYMAYTIEVSGVRKSFRNRPVLTGLDLHVLPGTVCALLGPNGAGKTTTVRILSTLIRADGGTVTVAGLDVATQGRQVRAAISLTGQYAAVDEILTGAENLMLMARLRHLPRPAARRRTAELLERFDLVDARDRRVGTYSGGMRRRLDIALGLVGDPQVVVLDEPTTGLDPRGRRDVWDAVDALRAGGTTVLLTTQYLDEADRLADRIAVVDRGRVVADGTADELKARVGGETVELHLPDGTALALAARVLAGRGRASLASADGLRMQVPTDGTAGAVRDLLELMAAHDVPVDRIALHRPTLDEVFLGLTAGPAVAVAA
jgi:ABC-2 type transport system ATP-binding protein